LLRIWFLVRGALPGIMRDPVRILIIEDETKTAQAIQKGLRSEGYESAIAESGEVGFFRHGAEPFDLLILDWMLPDRDGIEVLQAIRRNGDRVPVLLLTARDAIDDRVRGLDAGADDYLVKPFAFAELLARVRALGRRTEPATPEVLRVDDLEVHLVRREVRRAGREIHLTPTELNLLVYLMRYRDQVVTRSMLAADVWRETKRLTPLDNVIDVHLAHLRKKIDEGFDTRLIQTVRGVGFTLKSREDAP